MAPCQKYVQIYFLSKIVSFFPQKCEQIHFWSQNCFFSHLGPFFDNVFRPFFLIGFWGGQRPTLRRGLGGRSPPSQAYNSSFGVAGPVFGRAHKNSWTTFWQFLFFGNLWGHRPYNHGWLIWPVESNLGIVPGGWNHIRLKSYPEHPEHPEKAGFFVKISAWRKKEWIFVVKIPVWRKRYCFF